jgi:AraC-like DNA-binding protein
LALIASATHLAYNVAVTPTWIRDRYSVNGSKSCGHLVMGSNWMLEMLRGDDGLRTFGLFLAAFGIIQLRQVNLQSGEFVGYSAPGDPPASWLTTSLVFEMGTLPLAETPEQLIMLVKHPWPHTPIEVGLRASSLSKKAKTRIAATYKNGISIGAIASQLGVSHAHLSRQFKRDFDLTPLDYRHHLQVNAAVERLRQGGKISDAAYEVGFNEASRFYEDFRKVTATSPGECLDLMKKRNSGSDV